MLCCLGFRERSCSKTLATAGIEIIYWVLSRVFGENTVSTEGLKFLRKRRRLRQPRLTATAKALGCQMFLMYYS